MNKKLFLISIMVTFFACSRLSETEKELRENINKTLQNMDSIETPESYTVLFIYRGDSYEEFMTRVLDIEYVEDKFYMVMDPEGNFLEQNNDIPRWISDASVLIDAENKIKMVGAPWVNEDMTKLFYKTINHE